MADHGLLSVVVVLLLIVLFSALAARADQQLWSKCRRHECCLLSQRRIALGKAM